MMTRYLRSSSIFAFALVSTGCGAAPQVAVDMAWNSADLHGGATVYFLSIATSDDYSDRRTGISLSTATRRTAAAEACAWLKEERTDLQVACYTDQSSNDPSAEALLIDFALGKRIEPQTWGQVAETVHAKYVLLARPEAVEASKTNWTVNTLQSGLLGGLANRRGTTGVRGYTVSMFLVDAASGKSVWSTLHSASDSKTTSKGYGGDPGATQMPPAAPILARIMKESLDELPK